MNMGQNKLVPTQTNINKHSAEIKEWLNTNQNKKQIEEF